PVLGTRGLDAARLRPFSGTDRVRPDRRAFGLRTRHRSRDDHERPVTTMGYDIFITRASSTLETEEHPISEADWLAVIAADPDLERSQTDYYERRTQDGQIERIYDTIWTAHPDTPPFLLMDGAIQIKNPDEATIRKMVEIARKLDARVLGEED